MALTNNNQLHIYIEIFSWVISSFKKHQKIPPNPTQIQSLVSSPTNHHTVQPLWKGNPWCESLSFSAARSSLRCWKVWQRHKNMSTMDGFSSKNDGDKCSSKNQIEEGLILMMIVKYNIYIYIFYIILWCCLLLLAVLVVPVSIPCSFCLWNLIQKLRRRWVFWASMIPTPAAEEFPYWLSLKGGKWKWRRGKPQTPCCFFFSKKWRASVVSNRHFFAWSQNH